jgi:predicted acylesterase/phospholipase RssA
MYIERIYWCGGGTTSVAHAGVLQVLNELQLLSPVKEMLGISAGAMFALSLCLGFTIEEIRHLYLTFDFQNLTELLPGPDCLENLSLDSGKNLLAFIEATLHIKGYCRRVTFKDLATSTQTKYNLRVFATDINTSEFLEFSSQKTPNFVVADAVAASMSLPLIFKPVIDPRTGNWLIDGAAISNYPITFLSQSERQTLLGVVFDTTPIPKTQLDIQDIAFRPISLSINHRTSRETAMHFNKTIVVNTRGFLPVDWNMTNDTRIDLLDRGINAVKKWWNTYRTSIPRRYSSA